MYVYNASILLGNVGIVYKGCRGGIVLYLVVIDIGIFFRKDFGHTIGKYLIAGQALMSFYNLKFGVFLGNDKVAWLYHQGGLCSRREMKDLYRFLGYLVPRDADICAFPGKCGIKGGQGVVLGRHLIKIYIYYRLVLRFVHGGTHQTNVDPVVGSFGQVRTVDPVYKNNF